MAKQKKLSSVNQSLWLLREAIDPVTLTKIFRSEKARLSTTNAKLALILVFHPFFREKAYKFRLKFTKGKNYNKYPFDNYSKVKYLSLDLKENLMKFNINSISKYPYNQIEKEVWLTLKANNIDPYFWTLPFISRFTYGILPIPADFSDIYYSRPSSDNKDLTFNNYPTIRIFKNISKQRFIDFIENNWDKGINIKSDIKNQYPEYLKNVDFTRFAIGCWVIFQTKYRKNSLDETEKILTKMGELIYKDEQIGKKLPEDFGNSEFYFNYDKTELSKLKSYSTDYLNSLDKYFSE